jgi:hypothetical protein
MTFQIEYFTNEFSKKTNEKIINLIDHEYIKISFFLVED